MESTTAPNLYDSIDKSLISKVLEVVGDETPVYVYLKEHIEQQAQLLKDSFPGATIKYAMKALSNVNILQIFDKQGFNFDASSIYELMRGLKSGIHPSKLQFVS